MRRYRLTKLAAAGASNEKAVLRWSKQFRLSSFSLCHGRRGDLHTCTCATGPQGMSLHTVSQVTVSQQDVFDTMRSNTHGPGKHVEDTPKETTEGSAVLSGTRASAGASIVKDAFMSKAAFPAKLKAQGFDSSTIWMARRLGEPLGSIQGQTLDPCDQPVTGIADFEFLCSYSWAAPNLRGKQSKGLYTICVPGDPPHMIYPSLPRPFDAIKSDKAISYRDANLGRLKHEPWQPMFRALQIMRPGYKLDDVDIIINRNVLRALLRFAKGQRVEDFRLNLAMMKNTLLVTPKLRTAFEGQTGQLGRLFERTFTKAASEEQARGTHHRAIRYKIGPLNCVVLFECDAQVDDEAFRTLEKHGYSWKEPSDALGGQVLHDWLVQQRQHSTDRERAQFKRLSGAPFKKPEWKAYKTPLKVIHHGQGTTSSHIAELMTSLGSTSKKTLQMWLGRTPVSQPSRLFLSPSHITLTISSTLSWLDRRRMVRLPMHSLASAWNLRGQGYCNLRRTIKSLYAN